MSISEKEEKIEQAICYLLKHIESSTRVRLMKLIFFADKYHLLHFGRTITKDDYYALQWGPISSVAKNLVTNGTDLIEYDDECSCHYIKNDEFEIDLLSETDIQALDFIAQHAESLWHNNKRAVDYSHMYPEWKQYEEDFDTQKISRGDILLEDMFSTFEGDVLSKGLTPEYIEMMKEEALEFVS